MTFTISILSVSFFLNLYFAYRAFMWAKAYKRLADCVQNPAPPRGVDGHRVRPPEEREGHKDVGLHAAVSPHHPMLVAAIGFFVARGAGQCHVGYQVAEALAQRAGVRRLDVELQAQRDNSLGTNLCKEYLEALTRDGWDPEDSEFGEVMDRFYADLHQ